MEEKEGAHEVYQMGTSFVALSEAMTFVTDLADICYCCNDL